MIKDSTWVHSAVDTVWMECFPYKKAKILLLNMIPRNQSELWTCPLTFYKDQQQSLEITWEMSNWFLSKLSGAKKHLMKSYIKSDLSWKNCRHPSSSIYTRRSQELMCHSERSTCQSAHILSDILQLFCKSFMDSYWPRLQLRLQVTFLFDRIYVSPHLSKYGLTYY